MGGHLHRAEGQRGVELDSDIHGLFQKWGGKTPRMPKSSQTHVCLSPPQCHCWLSSSITTPRSCCPVLSSDPKKKLSLLRIFLLWLPFGCCKYREILKMDESIGNGFKGHDTAQHGHAFAACRQYQVILPTHPTIFPRYMQALRKGAL